MINLHSTIRDYLMSNPLDGILDYLDAKHKEFGHSPQREGYKKVIESLIAKPKPEEKHILIAEWVEDQEYPKDSYFDISIKNPDFVKSPPLDSKWWGGSEDDEHDHPEGSYNCNWKGYIEKYAFIGNEREKFAYGSIEVDEKSWKKAGSWDIIVAEVIWELTFYGFEEGKCQRFFDSLKDDDFAFLDLSDEEID